MSLDPEGRFHEDGLGREATRGRVGDVLTLNGDVLLVEDDPSVRETGTLLLERAGHRVTAAGDGAAALELLSTRRFDLVVLDLMLPGMDGFEVCRQIRQSSGVPIIMLTARSAASDVVNGLSIGADDYVTKPFVASVFLARVQAVLRRSSIDDLRQDRPERLQLGGLDIDMAAMTVTLNGELLSLTTVELRLLVELAREPGHVKSREELLERVWGYDYLGDSRLVDMAIMRLRDKLKDSPREPRYISTVRGFGYRFERQP
jgi:two-component system response regulator MtrA